MGTLLHSCVEVHEKIELSFGLLSGVGGEMGVLDGGSHAPTGKERFQSFCPIGFNGVFFIQKCN